MPTFTFPVLIGDIGGTNARFALLRDGGEPAHLPRVLTAAYAPHGINVERAEEFNALVLAFLAGVSRIAQAPAPASTGS